MNAVLNSASESLLQCTIAIRKTQFFYKRVTIHIHFKAGHICNFHTEMNGEVFLMIFVAY